MSKKVIGLIQVNALGDGIKLEAAIAAGGMRSGAPGGMWATSLACSSYDGGSLRRCEAIVRETQAYKGLLERTRTAGLDSAKLDAAQRAVFDHIAPTRLRPARQFMKASCMCPDFGDGSVRWCKHVAALGWIMVSGAETEPALFMDLIGVRIGVMLEDDLVSVKVESDSDEDIEVEVDLESDPESYADVDVDVEVQYESEGGVSTASGPWGPWSPDDDLPIAKRLKRRLPG
tara:strand:- start:419 stop:1111 length:693 start_codon:yes stop_codon:yes gene_type:complete